MGWAPAIALPVKLTPGLFAGVMVSVPVLKVKL
jgi:hypothetical protein